MYTDYTEENNESYYADDDSGQNRHNIDKEKLKRIIFWVLCFVIVLVLIIVVAKSCSKKENPAPTYNNEQTLAVAISRETISLEVGQNFQLYAEVVGIDSKDPVILWLSENSEIVVVDDSGLVTALKEGTTNIVARYIKDGKIYSNKCAITVTSANVKLESIDIVQENISILKGSGVLLQVKTNPSDAKVEGLIFTSDDPSIASVNEEGRVTALEVGTTTINVKTSDSLYSDKLIVRVVENGQTVINPVSLTLSGLSNGLKVSSTATVIYSITPSNATNKTLTWTSTNPNVATVNSSGVVTGRSAGTCTIVASTSNGVSASLEVTVEANTIPVQNISIAGETTFTMQEGWTRMLSYLITPINATNKNVTFTTSNRNVIYVDSNGVLAALSPGTATVTITTVDGKKTAVANITVIAVPNSQATSTGTSTGTSSGSSSSSSSGSSSSSSSSYTTGQSNPTTSSGSSSATCTSQDILTIKHSEKGEGPIISSYGFYNAVAMKKANPTITVIGINSCIKAGSLKYNIYYGTSESNISSASKASGQIDHLGSTIKLNLGNGYYKVKVSGTISTTGATISKTYYVIVSNSSSTSSTSSDKTKPIINSLSAVRTGETLSVTVTATDTGSGLKKISYCHDTKNNCTPTINLYTWTGTLPTTLQRKTASIKNTVKTHVCANATDGAGNVSLTTCTAIYNSNVSAN